jgi:DMSO/TMAO reductase YedYZ molybdopterin-dependent catalytic subunit
MAVAVLVGGAPTPTTAVGSRAIDATPGAVKDWAIRHFGENDKTILLTGIYTVLAVIALAIGVVSARHRRLSIAMTGLLGLVGLGAAVADRTTLVEPVAKVAPAIVALVVSITLIAYFSHLLVRPSTSAERGQTRSAALVTAGAPSRAVERPGRPIDENLAPPGFDRRAFLAAAAASGAVAAGGFGVSRAFGDVGARSRDAVTLPRAADAAPALERSMTLDGVRGITPFITPNADFYRVDTALSVPQINAPSWSLRIHGMVDEELELSFAELLDMPLTEHRMTVACVSNEVGGHYAGNARWLGVLVSDLLDQVGVSGAADAVKSTSVDGMTIGTPLAALTDGRPAMLALGMNGEPLPLAHGFPVRMVVPGLYGYVSATKWLSDLELTRFADFEAYWTSRGFAEQAPIKTFSRIDVPTSFARLKTGRNAVAGVAWAQDTGIDAVEVRVDGGSWQQTRLAGQDNVDTWRQWVFEWDASPGDHLLEVRATDQSGYTQTSRRVSPRPDGATGWHSVNVSVA